jgi:hypothetical protein
MRNERIKQSANLKMQNQAQKPKPEAENIFEL